MPAQIASGGIFPAGSKGFIHEVGTGLNAGKLVVMVPARDGDTHVVVAVEHVDYIGTEASDDKPEN